MPSTTSYMLKEPQEITCFYRKAFSDVILESVILDRGPQFVAELTKELNKMLEIEIKLLILFHLKTDSQIERMNQELEQYIWFFINHRQKNWP